MPKRKLIIVSNRLPISVKKIKGKLKFNESAGGLAQSMSSLDRSGDVTWVGWPGICDEDLSSADKKQIIEEFDHRGLEPVFLTKKQKEGYYSGYSNDTIWPVFHYFQSLASFNTENWNIYKQVNRIFAKSVEKVSEPDSTIWVHDYQLMMLPSYIRAVFPDAKIGFFLHIPFPSYEIFRLLPNGKDLLEGLLGANLIGFHIYDYARHFLSSVFRNLGLKNIRGSLIYGDRLIKVDAFPIGIDYEKFANAYKDIKVQKELTRLEDYYKGKKVILSMDRLDYTKGILKRLEAFEIFLKEYKGFHKKINLIVVAVPSRTEVELYQKLRGEVETTISRINGKFGSVDWTPISYQFRNLPFEEVAALFIHSDVALLTPLRDGMNLVAKEFVASKQDIPGSLILSEFTGASDELPEAITINPNDITELVRSIYKALQSSDVSQKAILHKIQARLKRYNVYAWTDDFIGNIDLAKRAQERESRKVLRESSLERIIINYKNASRRLILLDYDGTLRDFSDDYTNRKNIPTTKIKQILKDLSKSKNTKVCIISGRPKDTLEQWFGNLPIAIGAEHGGWIKNDGEWSMQHFTWKEYHDKVLALLDKYTERTPGSTIEEKDFSLVWHYRKVSKALANVRTANLVSKLRKLLEDSEFEVKLGSKVVEIKAKHIHKGIIVDDLLAEYKPDFTLAVGDDYTDEDMFRSLPDNGYSIKVGLRETYARYQVVSVDQVQELLKKLT